MYGRRDVKAGMRADQAAKFENILHNRLRHLRINSFQVLKRKLVIVYNFWKRKRLRLNTSIARIQIVENIYFKDELLF